MSVRWRSEPDRPGWPAMALFLTALALYAIAWQLPLWLGCAVATLAGYLVFTPLHEAAHGNVAGGERRLRHVQEAIGWVSGLLLLAPLPAFRTLHFAHHSHTNDPARDPDYWVAGTTPLGVALRCLTIIPHYIRELFLGKSAELHSARSTRRFCAAFFISEGALAILLAALGFGPEVLALWILPAVLAGALLAFAFDWLPHHPHRARGRFRDTRIVLGPGLSILTVAQNYHLVHHLFPRVPFHRYGVCFRALRADLEREGAPIIDAFQRSQE